MAANNSSSNNRKTSGRGTTTKKSSSSSGRTTKSVPAKTRQQAPNPERTREIYFFVFLAVSVFLLLSNFRICGVIGNVFSGFFFGLFGFVTYILPFYLFLSAAFLLSNGTNKAVVKKIIWIGIAFLLVGFIMQLAAGAEGMTVKKLYMAGYKHRKGGGVIFGGILSLLYKLIGKVGCIILTVLLIIVSLIEILNISLIDLFKKFGSSFKETANYQRDRRNEQYDDDDYGEYDEYDDAYDGSIYSTEAKEKHILHNTTILDENNKKPAPEQKKKRKKVEYPKDEMVELASDGSVKDIFNSKKKDDASGMPEFLKDSHRAVKEKAANGAAEQAVDSTFSQTSSDDMDAYQSISGLGAASYSEKKEEAPYIDNGSRVERTPGRTGIHTRDRQIKTDIFDLKPVRDDAPRMTKPTEIFSKSEQPTEIFSNKREQPTEIFSKSEQPAASSASRSSIFSKTSASGYESDEDTFESLETASNVSSISSKTRTDSEGTTLRSTPNAQSENKASSNVTSLQAVSEEKEPATEKPKRPKEYRFPPMSLLTSGKGKGSSRSNEEAVRENGIKLKETLESFGVNVTITDYSVGPSVTRFEMQPEQGVKVSKIVNLQDDLKLALAAEDIRIEAPIPGKPAVGIEIPNKENQKVYFRDIIDNEKFKNFDSNLAFAVGKDIGGQVILTDIAKAPHLLIAGATGSGKSVCINTIIMSILYKAKPEDVKMIMVDPKMVELTAYNGIPHLLIPVVTDPKKAAGALNWAVVEMTRRYQLFAKYNVRNIKGFNDKVKNEGPKEDDDQFKRMPQILVIVDELADLMMVAHAEVENAIIRLCQLARAAGIHLIIATQRPSVDVITGLIKANVPSRIAFAVSSGIDSRTILDMNGAEKLLGKGDMLFYPTGFPKPVRVQGALVSDEEVVSVVEFVKKYNDGSYDEAVGQAIDNSSVSSEGGQSSSDDGGDDDRYDEYFEDAARLVIEKDKASIGNLQRVFRIGFNRAARIMDQLCDAGVVGPEEGTKPRRILMTMDQFDEFMSV